MELKLEHYGSTPSLEDYSGSESSPEVNKVKPQPRKGINQLYPNLPKGPISEPNVSTDGNSSVNESIQSLLDQTDRHNRSRRLSLPHEMPPDPPEIFGPAGFKNWIIGAFVLLVLALLFFGGTTKDQGKEPPRKISCSEFLKLRDSFPDQDIKLFKSLQSGVESTISKPPEASVFSFFSTDEQMIARFMTEVITATKHCVNTTESHISLTSGQLNDRLITDYKEALVKKKVMLISNVDEASPESAKNLHSFCDTVNPISTDSIIFLTMHVPSEPTGKPVDYITKHLENRWRNLADHIRSPLITRILDQTFFLKP